MSSSRNGRLLSLLVLSVLLIGTIAVALGLSTNSASGDETQNPTGGTGPTAAQTKEFLESGEARPFPVKSETDLHAAQTMPHQELDRDEALELVEAVFEPELDATGGIVGELEPEKFLSDHAAVVPASSLSEEPGAQAAENADQPVLVESTLPLRTEDASGKQEPVDLGLEASEGELQPSNPLAEVGIPQALAEEISLPGAEVSVAVAGAPQSLPATNVEGEFAFYPGVAEDTDLLVSPTPQGVELMTDVRSAEAPPDTTYELSIPAGAELRPTKDGGAEVVDGGHAVVVVPPPTATDAAGDPVETELQVSGSSLVVSIAPSPSSAYPILVDPALNESWRWTTGGSSLAGWNWSTTNSAAMNPVEYARWTYPTNYPGLDVTSGYGGNAAPGDNADWGYWVPRLNSDVSRYGAYPTTWVGSMGIEGLAFLPWGNYANYPALVVGLVNPAIGWAGSGGFVHYGGEGEVNDGSYTHSFWNGAEAGGTNTGDRKIKGAGMNLVTYEYEYPSKTRDAYIGNAWISVWDEDAPKVLSLTPPTGWTTGPSASIGYGFEDTGLGVRSAGVRRPGETSFQAGGGADFACAGTTVSPCPRKPISTEAGLPQMHYVPSAMPTGIDTLEVVVGDPFWTAGHTAAANVQVKVDNTAPVVALSGSLTEQAKLGTERGSYVLTVEGGDGTAGAPQSGVTMLKVMSGEKALGAVEQKCETQNCTFSHSFTIAESAIGAGSHTVEAVVQDGAGNRSVKKLTITYTPDHKAPGIKLAGPLTSAPKGWIMQKAYQLEAEASDQGTGVKRLTTTLDSATTLQTKQQTCASGGCTLAVSPTVDATALSGGAHELTVIAEDASGNISETHLKINVDPNGTATVASVARALQAAEGTGAPTTVGTSREEATIEGTESGLELTADQGGFEVKNPAIPLQVSASPGNGFSLRVFNTKLIGSCIAAGEESETAPQKSELCENAVVGGEVVGKELNLQPSSIGSGASAMTLEGSASTLSTNTQTEQDTVIRPLYEGAIDYQVLRGSHAPASASWSLEPPEGQHLKAVDARHVELIDSAGHATLTAVAETAHDAIGQTVPTKLTVSGSEKLTLEIETPGSAVFPVVAGMAIRGGTFHVTAEGPKSEAELRREEERVKREENEIKQMEKEGRKVLRGPNFHGSYSTVFISRVGPPRATVGSSSQEHEFEFSSCDWGEPLPEFYPPGLTPEDRASEAEQRGFARIVGNCIKAGQGMYLDDAERILGTAHVAYNQEVWVTESDLKHLECLKTGPRKPAMVHCYVAPQKSKTAVTVGGNYRYQATGSISECFTLFAHLTVTRRIELQDPFESFAGTQGEGSTPTYCQWPARPGQ